MAIKAGQTVYFSCKAPEGARGLQGVVIDIETDGVVVAISGGAASGLSNCVAEQRSEGHFGFLKVPGEALVRTAPKGWRLTPGAKVPKFRQALAAWEGLDLDAPLESSEVEATLLPHQEATGSVSRPTKEVLAGLKAMEKNLWGTTDSEESGSESSEDEEEEVKPRKKSQRGHLAPGSSSLGKATKKSKKSSKVEMEDQLQQAMLQSLSKGESPSDLMPMMMMSMLLSQQAERRHRKRSSRKEEDFLGGSSSDSGSDSEAPLRADNGMKAVVALHRMQKRVTKHPKSIMREFEKDLVEELGVVEGQAWSVKDWLRKQPWGKFKGLYRSAVMDCAAYELLRAGHHDAAGAQLVQNMKSKLQSVLEGGSWQTAWQLTGLPDPLTRKEFAGTNQEMAVISGYLSSLAKLKKKVKEAGTNPANEDAE